MIEIVRSGPRVELSADERQRLRADFERSYFAVLPRLLEGSLLASLLDHLDGLTFTDGDKALSPEPKEITNVERLSDPAFDFGLSLLFNDPRLFEAVSEITGCPPVKGFVGRVIRTVPGRGHFVAWHVDYGKQTRLVALRVNLSRTPFQGGLLQFRGPGSEEIASECPNGACGDGVLFRPTTVMHRNSELIGSESKTTFSGWFTAEPQPWIGPPWPV